MRNFLCSALLALPLLGCPTAPPPSRLPDAQAAIDRMRATVACGRGVQASAKLDYFGQEGRVRGSLMLIASKPARVRMDVLNPFVGGPVATLTSDGKDFALADQRDKRFYKGPATTCNISRLTNVPLPGHVLVDLLRGQAPVLVKTGPTTIEWSGGGYYVVKIPGTHQSSEEIHIAPRPDDWTKPWAEQRMRVLDVKVEQAGYVLYHAELDEHARAAMSKEQVDPANIDPPIPPSGPDCDAEVPMRLHVDVPELGNDVRFRYEQISWNPPLQPGVFTQPPLAGLEVVPVQCE